VLVVGAHWTERPVCVVHRSSGRVRLTHRQHLSFPCLLSAHGTGTVRRLLHLFPACPLAYLSLRGGSWQSVSRCLQSFADSNPTFTIRPINSTLSSGGSDTSVLAILPNQHPFIRGVVVLDGSLI